MPVHRCCIRTRSLPVKSGQRPRYTYSQGRFLAHNRAKATKILAFSAKKDIIKCWSEDRDIRVIYGTVLL